MAVIHAVTRTRLLIAAALVLLAALLRLGFVWQTQAHPLLNAFVPDLDDAVTWQAARGLARTSAAQPSPAIEMKMLSAPLKTLTTALGQRVLGESVLRHRVAGALLHSLRFGLLFLTACVLIGSAPAAAAATLLLVLLPACIYADATAGKAALELSLLAVLLAVLVGGQGRVRKPRAALAGGAVLGTALAQLVSCQLLAAAYVAPVLALVACARSLRPGLRLLIGTGLLLVLLPAVGLLRLVGSDARGSSAVFLPRSGIDQLIALRTPTGAYHPLDRVAPNLVGHTFQSRLLAERALGRALTPGQADRYHRQQALALARDRPGLLLRGMAVKLRAFAGRFEIPTEHSVPHFAERSSVLGWSPIEFPLLLALAAAGVIAGWASSRGTVLWLAGLVLAVVLVNCLGCVSWRYRLPAAVPCVPLAALALRRLWQQRRAPLRLAGPLAPALVLAAVGLWPPDPELVARGRRRAHGNTLAAQRQADLLNEVASLQAERQQTNTADRLSVRTRLAVALAEAGHHGEAHAEAAALANAPVVPAEAARVHLQYLVWLGDYPAASAFLTRLRRQDPAAAEVARQLPGELERAAVQAFVWPQVDGSPATGQLLVQPAQAPL